jgi:choline-sulfatase
MEHTIRFARVTDTTRRGQRPTTPASPNRPAPASPQGVAEPQQRSSRRWYWSAAGLALLMLATGAWWFTHRPALEPGRPALKTLEPLSPADQLNLVVITLDTTRADHISAYGSTRVRTPAIDALAHDGVLFEAAMTAAPLTLPAHSSIFTGKFPPEHGARDNGGFFLSPDQTTLAEVLKTRGFRTGGFIAAYVLDHKWGIDQGFEKYDDDLGATNPRGRSMDAIQRPGNEVLDRALPWIDSVKQDRFFAWIHLYDPHAPYEPPEPFASEYKGRPYRGEIAFTDSLVGRVIEHLRAASLLDSTVIVVMGDHGESLGDHGEDAHGFFVYESATHVPFIIRAPFGKLRGRRVADPVRLVDMMPTALTLLGLDPPKGMSGASLLPLMTGEKAELGLEGYAEAMYPLHHYGWSDLRAIRSGRYKAIAAPRPELYDLQEDPGETTNLFATRPALGEQMVARVRQMDETFRKVAPAATEVDVDPEVRARLAALGYVGQFVASANDARTDRADPKDKIGLFNLLSRARDVAADKDGFARAVPIFMKVLTEDPKVIDAWFSLGNLYFREGRYKDAIARYSKALELKPDHDLAVMNIASAYRHLGNDDAAMAGFERYLTIDPKDPFVRYQMGEIWLERGDTSKAEAEFRKALEIDSRVAQAHNALGAIAFGRGNLDEAERLAKQALSIRNDVRLAHYNLALIAEKRGDLQLAEKEYLLELEQHPEAYKAAFNLSQLYAQIGEKDLELDALRQSVDGNPEFAKGYVFLAKAYLDRRMAPAEVERFARKGLAVSPTGDAAALAHAVLADLYTRQGRRADAARELASAR